MALTTYSDISPRTTAYAAVDLLKRATPMLIIQQFGQLKPVPKNSSDTVKFRRYESLSAATVPLTEGVTPTGSSPTYTDYSATLKQYGDFLTLTDKIADTHEDPVLREYTDMLGEQAGETMERVIFGILKAGTNVYYANGSARTDVNEPLTLNLQRKVTRGFKRQNAKRITKKLSSTPSFNTENVSPSYIGLVHPDVETTVRGMTGFIDVKDYGGNMTQYDSEIGAVEDVRYLTSTIFESWADAGGLKGGGSITAISDSGTNADVYPVLYLSANAFGVTPLKGAPGQGTITPGVLNPGQMREGDPLAQRGYVSWKAYMAAVILHQLWLARAEVAVAEL